MSWTLTSPPNWVPNAVATDKGWEHPDTGELLVAIGGLATNDGAGPTPDAVTLGSSKLNWKTGDTFDVYVTFTEAVTVTGTPRIAVTIGVNTRYANYLSGSGTNKLKFRYTIVSGDTGAITVGDTIDLNSGTMVETAQKGKLGAFTIGNAGSGYTGNLGVSFTGGTGGSGAYGTAVVSSGSVQSISLANAGTGYTGAPSVVFNKLGSGASLTPVIEGGVVVGMTIVDPGQNYTGAPTITITDTGSGANATATCTIHDGGINKVTITAGGTDYDPDTTTVAVAVPGTGAAATVALKAVNAEVSLTGLVPDTTNVAVDNAITAPTVTLLGGTNFATGAPVVVKAVFAEDMTVAPAAGSPAVLLDIDAGSVEDVTIVNGGTGYHQATTTIAFDAAPAGGTTATGTVTVDAGVITAVQITEPGFGYTSVPAITVTDTDVTPGTLADLTAVLSTTVQKAAEWAGADANDPLRTFYFQYNVESGVSAGAGNVAINGTMQDPSLITDAAGNEFDGSFTPPSTSTVTINGTPAAAPTVSSVTALSGTKKIGDSILISVNFSQKVSITGSPIVNFTIGTAAKTASYYSGSGSTTLVFKYVVVEGDTGATAVGSNALALNGGTIKNSSLVAATITHSAASSTQTVDGVRPAITAFARVGGPGYETSDNLDFTVTFSSAVTVTGTPRIYVGIGENTRYAAYTSGSGTTSLTFRYTIQATDYAPIPGQGFALDNVITLNGGTLKDASGNSVGSLQFRRPVNTTVTVNA